MRECIENLSVCIRSSTSDYDMLCFATPLSSIYGPILRGIHIAAASRHDFVLIWELIGPVEESFRPHLPHSLHSSHNLGIYISGCWKRLGHDRRGKATNILNGWDGTFGWQPKEEDGMKGRGCLCALVPFCHCENTLMDTRANSIGQTRTGKRSTISSLRHKCGEDRTAWQARLFGTVASCSHGAKRLLWSKKRRQAD